MIKLYVLNIYNTNTNIRYACVKPFSATINKICVSDYVNN